ncbi:MAG: 7-cyano-7-deazaguanine synthase [Acidithiobacillus sp.]|uniref:7-cyano-7-deazaguanine synthase n=1 Tax=Acidithiobacillus sp. TaxID=1872118 RepID=UPI003CFE79CB
MIEHRPRVALRPSLPPAERSLLLCSGGVESFTLAHAFAAHTGAYLLFLDYGQRAAAQEWARVQRLGKDLRLEQGRFDLRAFGEAVGRLRPHRYHVPTPHRNLLAVAAAANVASGLGRDTLVLGTTADDGQTDRNGNGAFLAALAATLRASDLNLATPLAHYGKAEVIRCGEDLGVPWEMSYSCILGYETHCGRCPQCIRRRQAFQDAGLGHKDVVYSGH